MILRARDLYLFGSMSQPLTTEAKITTAKEKKNVADQAFKTGDFKGGERADRRSSRPQTPDAISQLSNHITW
jgi:hypothetical protein